jgi:4-hydroxyphenylacetate decarboxylase small subunit
MKKAQGKNHQDCANFLPLDVAKGLCNRSGEIVFIDTPPCGEFAAAPKCRNCSHFSLAQDGESGTCTGFDIPATAYPDLRAMNCERHTRKAGTGRSR